MAGTIELATSPTTLSSAHDEIFGPRTVLIAVAVLELLASLRDFLFGRMSILFRDPLELAELGIGDVLAKLYLACHACSPSLRWRWQQPGASVVQWSCLAPSKWCDG
jgi:hypothetical protein